MSRRIYPGPFSGVAVGTLAGLLSACGGGGDDAPVSDAGPADAGDAATRTDGGTTTRWPVPSAFPADGPTQPGEGGACQLSVQCSNERQICVDDACVREERVTSAGLVFGDWRVLTPTEVRATTALPIEYVGEYLRTVLDEHGEVTVVGSAGLTSGANGVFTIGARTRVVELSADPWVRDLFLPLGDGFLDVIGGRAEYVGASETDYWSAEAQLATRLPVLPMSVLGEVRSLIHTPEGPVMVVRLTEAFGEPPWDALEVQRLDLASREFVPVDFADGPYLLDRVLGDAAMGPTGLELIVGERTPDNQLGRFSVHSVATGAERPLDTEPRPWEVGLRPVSSDRWVAVLRRDGVTSPCSSLAFTSESSAPVARLLQIGSDVGGGYCEYESFPRARLRLEPQFSPTPLPAVWIHNDDGELFAASSDGTRVRSFGLRAGLPVAMAARFGKTFEFMASMESDLENGLAVVERSLRRVGGI